MPPKQASSAVPPLPSIKSTDAGAGHKKSVSIHNNNNNNNSEERPVTTDTYAGGGSSTVTGEELSDGTLTFDGKAGLTSKGKAISRLLPGMGGTWQPMAFSAQERQSAEKQKRKDQLNAVTGGGISPALLLAAADQTKINTTTKSSLMDQVEEMWQDLTHLLIDYVFPPGKKLTHRTVARMCVYGKHGPGVRDPQTGAVRLKGGYQILRKHEEELLIAEEQKALVVDVYGGTLSAPVARMKKARTTSQSVRAAAAAAAAESGDNTILSTATLGETILSASRPTPLTDKPAGGLPTSAPANDPALKRTTVPNNEANLSAFQPDSTMVLTMNMKSGTLVKRKLLGQSAAGSAQSAKPRGGPNSSKSVDLSATISASGIYKNLEGLPLNSTTLAERSTCGSALDGSTLEELSMKKNRLFYDMTEITLTELKEILGNIKIPITEKDGGPPKYNTLADSIADALLVERLRRVRELKVAEPKLENIRRDTDVTKLKTTQFYSRTYPKAYEIRSWEDPKNVLRALHRSAYCIAEESDRNDPNLIYNVRCLRPELVIPPGSTKEGWDPYCCVRKTHQQKISTLRK